MKVQVIAAVTLGACALFAADSTTASGTSATDTKTSQGSTAATTAGNTAKNTSGQTADDAVSPEEGDYTYVEYDDDYVPYYRGYYYIDGVWVWRGSGRPPIPPPKFRPVPRPRPAGKTASPRPASAAALQEPVPVKPVAHKTVKVKRQRVKKPHRGRAAAPRGPHP